MGAVSVSSSATRSPFGINIGISNARFRFKRPSIVAFIEDKHDKISLVAPHEKIPLPIETPKKQRKRQGRTTKTSKRVKAVSAEEASPCNLEVDYSEAAAKLENIYKLSPTTDYSEDEDLDGTMRRRLKRRRNVNGDDSKSEKGTTDTVVRNPVKKVKRLNLDKRIALKRNKEKNVDALLIQRNKNPEDENEKIKKLVREYRTPIHSVRLDWIRTKMPPVLSSSEHAWLFKLMQPMKALQKEQKDLQKKLGREPTHCELADAVNVNVAEVKKQLDVGRAATNKLIKHNLRLVLFVIKKYFQDLVDVSNLEDFCQAGVQGLITAIERFETKRGSQLSTYGVFWIRHAIMRYMKRTNILEIPFSLESLRLKVMRAKIDLSFELHRSPTEDEIIKKVGISPERHLDVKRASRPVYSLHARHPVTKEELINLISDDDDDGGGADKRRQPALLRLALDDVLDSLKPKESLVIRQRFGLDGKGQRTLGEIAGNLNISREMVRKHEMKAMMKLKHPTRVDYLRGYLVLN
uniref:Sigma factor n=1 Tax=California macrophylla TaxID=337344 RepID=A0A0G2SY96_9ROSI|nr:sigma factor [California macrophylla]